MEEISDGKWALSKKMGGELGEVIERFEGKQMECDCGHVLRLSTPVGYPHQEGLEDEKGEKWWLYYTCPVCEYGWSYRKIPRRIAAKIADLKQE